jgi:hypothetical protein
MVTPKSNIYAISKGFRTVYSHKPGGGFSSSQIGRSKSSMNHARNLPGFHGSHKYG